jgi:hypothetical protein
MEGRMRSCPNCGHQLGRTTENGFCNFACRVSFNARRKACSARRRRHRLRRLLADVHLFPPEPPLRWHETGPDGTG